MVESINLASMRRIFSLLPIWHISSDDLSSRMKSCQ